MSYKDFVHLHNHTEYSLLDSVMRIKDFVAEAKKQGMSALAITDHGNMYGAIKFYDECKENDIKPILGCEIYTTNHLDKEVKDNYHLILLAKNNKGYQNLVKLVSIATEHMYYKPRVDKALLRTYHEGLICLSACVGGEIAQNFLEGKDAEAEAIIDEFADIFGKEDFYLEIQNHGLAKEQKAYKKICLAAKKKGIKLVATNDIHYLRREESKIQDILHCIMDKKELSDPTHWQFGTDECYFRTAEEMYALFKDYENCLSNTKEIADKCNVELKFKQKLAPTFPKLPKGETEESYLRKICEAALPEKYEQDMFDVAKKRMNYELGVIKDMGFSGYFLIVRDFIVFARNNNIAIGPGRGSGAGSIVCYLSGITELDPLKLDLLFERFLNPERVSMPDIDTDIADSGRERVAQYMIDTYHVENTAKIITFQTMAAKGSIRNVAKVLGKPYSFGDNLAKMIGKGSIDDALAENEEFKNAYNQDAEVKELVDYAKKIEGLPRQKGSHAAGLVISNRPLKDILPVSLEEDGARTEYDKDEVERIGLLKMDLLGISYLSVIENAKNLIKEKYGKDIDFSKIPWDDEKSLKMIAEGDTFGIFQLESDGITQVAKKLAPTHYRDLIALVALYRPGPLNSGMVDDYINCKHGKQEIKYMHPLLEPILKETFGIILYQEQVMQIVQVLAGFSLGRADILRRAMGHKIPKLLQAQQKDFIEGCLKNNLPKDFAEKIFELILHFAEYGFNKSHSAAYGFISYQTAYLKSHYPLEYFSAYLSYELDNPEKLTKGMMLCRKRNIRFHLPDINKSGYSFLPEGTDIRIGFGTIKGLGEKLASFVIKEREKSPFLSVSDFLYRAFTEGKGLLSKTSFHALCVLGAFKTIYKNTTVLSMYSDLIFDSIKKYAKKEEKHRGSLNLFEDVCAWASQPPDIDIILKDSNTNFPKRDVSLEDEFEHLGFYATAYPLDAFVKNEDTKTVVARAIDAPQEFDGKKIVFGLLLESVRAITTKRGDKMAFISGESFGSKVDGVLFPEAYQACLENLYNGKKAFKIIATGQYRDERMQFIVKNMLPLEK